MIDARVHIHDGQSSRREDTIIPVLGSEDPNGRKYTMLETVGIAVGAASVLFKSEDGKRLDGVFDSTRAQKIVEQLMANIHQFANERVAEHVTVQEEKRAHILQREDWHDSPDAMVWAEKFDEMVLAPEKGVEIDTGLMVSWFANAMAAAMRPLERELRNLKDQDALYAGRKIVE